MALTLQQAPLLVYVAATLSLALVLLFLGRGTRPSRAFAVIAGSVGLFFLAVAMRTAAEDAARFAYWVHVERSLLLVVAPAVLYFACVYPQRRAWLPRLVGAPAFLAAVVALQALHRLDPAAFDYVSSTTAGQQAASAGEGWMTALYVLVLRPAYFATALLFARDYVRAAPGRGRVSILIVSASFELSWAYFATQDAGRLLAVAATPGPLGTGAWFTVFAVALEVATVVALAAYLAFQLLRSREAEVRAAVRRYLVLLALSVGSGVFSIAAAAAADDVLQGLRVFLQGVWNLALPVGVSYALLRLRLFDIDLKVRWTLKQSTVAAAFVGVFFVVSESAASFFQTEGGLGTYAGIAAAGLLVFALAPLQRVAETVASAAMPGVRSPGEMTADERARAYAEAARAAWADGAMQQGERLMLDRLRTALGLTDEQAHQLERAAAQDAQG